MPTHQGNLVTGFVEIRKDIPVEGPKLVDSGAPGAISNDDHNCNMGVQTGGTPAARQQERLTPVLLRSGLLFSPLAPAVGFLRSSSHELLLLH